VGEDKGVLETNMRDLEHERLLKLYELAINEEYEFLDAHQHRIAFYSGIVSALVAGTVVGLFQASEWYHLAILCVGPVLIVAVSAVAIPGTFRLYQRFLEAVTVRAKIEQKLGLTKKHSADDTVTDSFWQSEPIVPQRHIESRKECATSDAFIRKYSKRGYHLWTICLLSGFVAVGILMFALILYLTIDKVCV